MLCSASHSSLTLLFPTPYPPPFIPRTHVLFTHPVTASCGPTPNPPLPSAMTTADGRVWLWGLIGEESRPAPVPVTSMAHLAVIDTALGRHSLFIVKPDSPDIVVQSVVEADEESEVVCAPATTPPASLSSSPSVHQPPPATAATSPPHPSILHTEGHGHANTSEHRHPHAHFADGDSEPSAPHHSILVAEGHASSPEHQHHHAHFADGDSEPGAEGDARPRRRLRSPRPGTAGTSAAPAAATHQATPMVHAHVDRERARTPLGAAAHSTDRPVLGEDLSARAPGPPSGALSSPPLKEEEGTRVPTSAAPARRGDAHSLASPAPSVLPPALPSPALTAQSHGLLTASAGALVLGGAVPFQVEGLVMPEGTLRRSTHGS